MFLFREIRSQIYLYRNTDAMSNVVYAQWKEEARNRGLRVIRSRYVQCEECRECWECSFCSFSQLDHTCKIEGNQREVKGPKESTRAKVGEVCIGSGLVVLGDPVNFDSIFTPAFRVVKNKEVAEISGIIISQTGYGDGRYPVFATFSKDGRVSKLEVEFE